NTINASGGSIISGNITNSGGTNTISLDNSNMSGALNISNNISLKFSNNAKMSNKITIAGGTLNLDLKDSSTQDVALSWGTVNINGATHAKIGSIGSSTGTINLNNLKDVSIAKISDGDSSTVTLNLSGEQVSIAGGIDVPSTANTAAANITLKNSALKDLNLSQTLAKVNLTQSSVGNITSASGNAQAFLKIDN
ncbi:hypothetical protein, partial [Helicobacter sp. 11S03491-1]|uniref:hypothetical protein n=1 Tax=Helicobacter sp. 11S03491-1 TaxID=1476196 RepID=UPI0015D9B07C